MIPNIKRTILITVLGLIIIGAGVFYHLYNKKPISPERLRPQVSTTSIALYNEFSADSVAAKKKYSRDNEAVAVTGIVSSISQNQDKQTIILLQTDESGASVNCTMEGAAGNIKEGDNVSIKGFCTGMGAGDADLGIAGDVYMIRCFRAK